VSGAFWRALAAIVIAYVLVVSSVADYLAHQCGSHWFDYTFQLSFSITSLALFGILGVVVYLICMIRQVGAAVHWWFWLAFAIMVLVANSFYAAAAPAVATTDIGGPLQCAVRR